MECFPPFTLILPGFPAWWCKDWAEVICCPCGGYLCWTWLGQVGADWVDCAEVPEWNEAADSWRWNEFKDFEGPTHEDWFELAGSENWLRGCKGWGLVPAEDDRPPLPREEDDWRLCKAGGACPPPPYPWFGCKWPYLSCPLQFKWIALWLNGKNEKFDDNILNTF